MVQRDRFRNKPKSRNEKRSLHPRLAERLVSSTPLTSRHLSSGREVQILWQLMQYGQIVMFPAQQIRTVGRQTDYVVSIHHIDWEICSFWHLFVCRYHGSCGHTLLKRQCGNQISRPAPTSQVATHFNPVLHTKMWAISGTPLTMLRNAACSVHLLSIVEPLSLLSFLFFCRSENLFILNTSIQNQLGARLPHSLSS